MTDAGYGKGRKTGDGRREKVRSQESDPKPKAESPSRPVLRSWERGTKREEMTDYNLLGPQPNHAVMSSGAQKIDNDLRVDDTNDHRLQPNNSITNNL